MPTETDSARNSSESTSDAASRNSEKLPLDVLGRRGLITGVLVLLSLALVRGLAGLFVAVDGVEPVAWPAILGTGVVVTLGATAVYGVLTRLSARPNRVFTALAVVVLVASMVPLVVVAPSIPGVTTAILVVLGVMHVVAAVASVAALTGRIL